MIDLQHRERALLVTIEFRGGPYRDAWPSDHVAAELRELVRSTGLEIARELAVSRERPTPALLIGRGKAQEIQVAAAEHRADVVIVSHDLSSAQQRNLEELIGIKVIDRTQLILDIFAQRAHSQEGKVQVALAQHEYLLPRLAGKGVLLSRLGGGIGTRGPGEQKLEMDRRRIRARIAALEQEMGLIRQRRGHSRRERQARAVPTAALVGYTNAGKSTLFNAVLEQTAGAAQPVGARRPADVKDQLFTTLDPMSRRIVLPTRQAIILSDTVGFLHRLPHHLIEAFQATLEEVREAALLLHVVDAGHPFREEQMAAVERVLRELRVEQTARLVVYNKMDQVGAQGQRRVEREEPEGVCVSALTGAGVPGLLERMAHQLASLMTSVTVVIPQGAQPWIHRLYEEGAVLARRDVAGGVWLEARVPARIKGLLAKEGFLTHL